MPRAVIATIGEDRPGIVAELTSVVHDMNLNIDDSRMTVLGGEFAVLLSVTGGSVSLDMLEQRIKELAASSGLAYLFRLTGDRDHVRQRTASVQVEALDHPGIVHTVAGFFHERGINIRDLETQTTPAAHTGTPVFNLSITAELAVDADLTALQLAFEDFCEQANLDGTITGK